MTFFRTLRILSVVALFATATPSFAGVNKDMVQLQTQVQQLLDAVARLQQSNDERMGVLKDLVQQSADSVNRMSVTVSTLEKEMASQQTASGARVDQVSGQVQAINDSLDEVKARMNRLEKLLTAIDSNQQSMSANLQNLQPSTTSAPATLAAPPTSTVAPSSIASTSAPPAPGSTRIPIPVPAPKTSKPVIDDLYKAAYGDFMAARYAIATAEFGDVIKSYPDAPLAGNSYYYLGEIDYRAGKYPAAAKDYDRVLEQFPDNSKIPAAHLHKGQALTGDETE